MRLIDADALKEFYGKWSNKHTEFLKPEVDLYIDRQPTIDAVPVVRCKDCQWAHLDGWFCGGVGMMPEHTTLPESFCDHGERMDGEG